MADALSEREAMRRWVETWKRAGEELDRMEWGELSRLSEEQAAIDFCSLDCDPGLVWTPPENMTGSGLIEQQRIFVRWHDRTARSPGGS